MDIKPTFFITTTIPVSLGFFKGNLKFLDKNFKLCAISSEEETLSDFCKKESIDFYHIPMKREISLWSDIKCLYLFTKLFLRRRPDIVHGNTPKASFLSMIASKITKVPIRIYMCHGLRYQGTSGILNYTLKLAERISCKCATEVICVSMGIKKTLIKDKICSHEKTKIIHFGSANGIDLQHFSPSRIESKHIIRQSLNIPYNNFVFIYAGRIVRDKGINELISAFDRLYQENKNINLILLGNEEEKLNPISKTSKHIITTNKNISFLGFQSDIRKFMVASDTFILPSHREGFGMVVIEAGAMGLPSIVTDINGCNEIIIEGENGTIIPPRDIDALYNAMKRFANDRQTTSRMASNARSMVANRYEQKFVWDGLLEEYKRLLRNNKIRK